MTTTRSRSQAQLLYKSNRFRTFNHSEIKNHVKCQRVFLLIIVDISVQLQRPKFKLLPIDKKKIPAPMYRSSQYPSTFYSSTHSHFLDTQPSTSLGALAAAS